MEFYTCVLNFICNNKLKKMNFIEWDKFTP